MNCPERLLRRITITIDIDHEPGYQYVATAALLDVISHLAHDGIEPLWVTLEITGPTTTP
jgi:hypothetical protein